MSDVRPSPQSLLSRIDGTAKVTAIGLLLLLAVMLARVAQLQLSPSHQLQQFLGPKVSTRTELPVRGDLSDRRGRLLSASRFGYRLVIDPMTFPDPPDAAIVALARASGLKAEEIGERVMWAREENLKRLAASGKSLEVAKPQLSLKMLLARVVGSGEVSPPSQPELIDQVVQESEADPEKTKGPIRYLPIPPKGIVEEAAAKAVFAARVKDSKGRETAIPGVRLERRAVREYTGGAEVATLAGRVNADDMGLTGLEHRLNELLSGERGRVTYVRDARGRPLWIEPGQVQPAKPGEDVRLTLDLELQKIGYEELLRGVDEADAAGGRLVIADPHTGELLAMVDIVRPVKDTIAYPWVKSSVKKTGQHEAPPPPTFPGGRRFVTLSYDPNAINNPVLARNRCIEDVYEPGSTFKPFVWSTITELGLAKTDEVFDTEGGRFHTFYGRYVEDVTKRDQMTWTEVLVNSSNIGMIKASERMSFAQLHDVCVRFGFGQPTGVFRLLPGQGLGGEASGLVTSLKRWSKYSQTSVAYGHEVAVTPVQMVRAFSAFCRTGKEAGTVPALKLITSDPAQADAGVTYRVLPPGVAELTRRTMQGVTENMERQLADLNVGGTGETGWKYIIFGKSGTAEIPLGKPPPGYRRPIGSSGYYDGQYNSSFIAGGPLEEPKLVVLVVIDDPGPRKVRDRMHYGSRVAGPVVRRIMERALDYVGAKPSLRVASTTISGADADRE